eukprot:GHVQ01019882.1.p1 GENE.GHVQ01019882.1~~GHVQ01019882.1.p1  ORF type:complete len:254 (-),score=84.23 GHVQ01019882.1:578-1339(-)
MFHGGGSVGAGRKKEDSMEGVCKEEGGSGGDTGVSRVGMQDSEEGVSKNGISEVCCDPRSATCETRNMIGGGRRDSARGGCESACDGNEKKDGGEKKCCGEANEGRIAEDSRIRNWLDHAKGERRDGLIGDRCGGSGREYVEEVCCVGGGGGCSTRASSEGGEGDLEGSEYFTEDEELDEGGARVCVETHVTGCMVQRHVVEGGRGGGRGEDVCDGGGGRVGVCTLTWGGRECAGGMYAVVDGGVMDSNSGSG